MITVGLIIVLWWTGSKVRVECKHRKTNKITYSVDGVTNSQGEYNILVNRDCGDDVCDVVLVESSDKTCNIPNAGRDRARVALTRNNGMTSDVRYANNMGFLSNQPLSACTQILQQYQLTEDQYWRNNKWFHMNLCLMFRPHLLLWLWCFRHQSWYFYLFVIVFWMFNFQVICFLLVYEDILMAH